ncbi:MAG: sigma-54-dependent Fis family transcriptional regulator [Deltaproteobacteria bacterium]|nr:sigma-54-dependent Fis family transcriptional regulator [Deltaproteobacteria bacterium]
MERDERARYTILIVEDDAANREYLTEAVTDEGYRVEGAGGGRAGLERIREGGIDLVVSDIRMPDLDGLDMMREIRTLAFPPHVITITAFGSIDTAIKAVRLGAFDYLTKPFQTDQLLLAIDKGLSDRGLRDEVERLRAEVERPYRLGNLIGRSAAMQEVFDLIRRLGQSSVSVLITGESGTGKELVARAIHHGSPRKGRAFVAVNCAAIPDTLLESELFGYKKGAFTDARADRPGMFLEADGGTLFFDEIAELSPALQAKLLRVIQEHEVRPLGASRSEKVDVRIIAATNRDLEPRLRDGTFREDLFYRLNVIQVALPPLRDRGPDIMLLGEHFLGAAAERARKTTRRFTQAAVEIMLAYPWPGNVRELENVVERAVALTESSEIDAADLPPQVRARRAEDLLQAAMARGLSLADLEREYIGRVLAAEGGNKTRAAQRLGLDRKTLYRKLEEYGRERQAGAPAGDDEDEENGR